MITLILAISCLRARWGCWEINGLKMWENTSSNGQNNTAILIERKIHRLCQTIKPFATVKNLKIVELCFLNYLCCWPFCLCEWWLLCQPRKIFCICLLILLYLPSNNILKRYFRHKWRTIGLDTLKCFKSNL